MDNKDEMDTLSALIKDKIDTSEEEVATLIKDIRDKIESKDTSEEEVEILIKDIGNITSRNDPNNMIMGSGAMLSWGDFNGIFLYPKEGHDRYCSNCQKFTSHKEENCQEQCQSCDPDKVKVHSAQGCPRGCEICHCCSHSTEEHSCCICCKTGIDSHKMKDCPERKKCITLPIVDWYIDNY